MNMMGRVRARCECCRADLPPFPAGSRIEPCRTCRRPMVLLRPLVGSLDPGRVRGLFDLAGAVTGILMMVLISAFVLTSMSPLRFSKWLTILIFAMGSVLAVDGILSIRTGIDKTWHRRRRGRPARMLGGAKIAGAVYALLMVVIGVTL